MSKVWTCTVAICLMLAGLLAGAAPASAGGAEIVVYERYERYQRLTIVRQNAYRQNYRPHAYRQSAYRLHHRPGYVYHRGQWLSAASMRAGVIVDRPIPARRQVHVADLNPRHHSWCADRYRSYHWRSNSFQPYHGPRQQCFSPYY
ncbi:MAG: BA14K family protein [Rhizobium sp.]|nr:BA14K family protein [Rhizobium sp.]